MQIYENNTIFGDVFSQDLSYTSIVNNNTWGYYMTNFIENDKIIFYPTIDLEATGKNIKSLRENAGLSVKKLANLVGFKAVQGIYHWQEGKTLPTMETLFLLSNIFHKKINEIVLLKENA